MYWLWDTLADKTLQTHLDNHLHFLLQFLSASTMKVYPSTRTAVHDYQIPADNRMRVKNGNPVRCENRDIRFPIVWEVNDHPLSHGSFVEVNWVILMDTSDNARRAMSTFESTLATPLGPHAFMKEYGKHLSRAFRLMLNAWLSGLIRVRAGTVVYGRSLDGPVDTEGYRTPDDDIFICCIGDG